MFQISREGLIKVLNAVMILCGLTAAVCIIAEIGWVLAPAANDEILNISQAVLIIFVLQEIFRLALQRKRLAYIRTRKLEVTFAVLACFALIFENTLIGWLTQYFPHLKFAQITLYYLAGTQVSLLVLLGLRTLRLNRHLSASRIGPGQVFILSFLMIITVGALLLKMPNATQHGGLSWVDSFFTSTSAVCVTGLVVVDTATRFTLLGKWIILLLMQIGGLGVMTLTYFFAHFLAGGVSVRDRILLQDLLSEESLSQITDVLLAIITMTFAIEGIGTLFIYHSLATTNAPAPDGLWFTSLFHAVSAFCNAGFSIYSNGLYQQGVRGNMVLQIHIMLLITLGGLGFPVLKNTAETLKDSVATWLGHRPDRRRRLSTNTRIVLLTSALLTFGGATLIYVADYALTSKTAPGSRILTALFDSVTARTAGFNTVPVSAWMPATSLIVMALMLVGGSPGGTAGGMKTTTLAVAVLSLFKILRGKPDLEAFRRKISVDTANRALAIVLLTVGWLTIVTTLLTVLLPGIPVLDLAFETVSAFGTVGLSRGVTALLTDPAKIVIITTMFIGRVGVLLFALSLVRRAKPGKMSLPEDYIIIS